MPMRIAVGACAEAGDCSMNVAQRHAANQMMRMMASRSSKILKRDGLKPLTREFPLFMHREQQCPLWVKSGHLQRKNPCPLYPRKRHQMRHVACPLGPKTDIAVTRSPHRL